jgi:hypothetical protein
VWISEFPVFTGLKESYDTNFKLIVINLAKATNRCVTGRKFVVTKGNVCRWQRMKYKLRYVSLSQKAFGGPEKEHFHELEQCY